jgi:2-hydroxy-4-carboxymuconate semialdehyde hemiacetal dehydrogenase
MTIKVALAGAGAFGIKHLDGIKNIDGVEVVSLIGRDLAKTREVADKYGMAHVTDDLAESLAIKKWTPSSCARPRRCTPAGHRLPEGRQARAGGNSAGRHPGWCRSRRLQKQTGLVAMCGHTRRFNPSHQWVHKKITAGEFNIQQMDVQTYFFRRTNMNALGQPRSWTDHLLWHHAAHTVDLFAYQAGSPIVKANAIQGPIHPDWASPWT